MYGFGPKLCVLVLWAYTSSLVSVEIRDEFSHPKREIFAISC